MIVYFTHSARGMSKYNPYYKRIYKEIESLGHTHSDQSLEEKFYSGSHQDRVSEYEKALDCIKKSDVVILEISTHSLSMGYVLHQALELNKVVLCLYKEGANALFVEVIDNENLFIQKYNEENIERVVKFGLQKALL